MDPSILLVNLVFRIFFMWICYGIAQEKNRSVGLALLWGFFFPFIAVIVYACLSVKHDWSDEKTEGLKKENEELPLKKMIKKND